VGYSTYSSFSLRDLSFQKLVVMGTEKPKNSLKGADWKNMDISGNVEPNSGQGAKKRIRSRNVPEHYFLPRRSLPSALAFYGAWIVAGVGAGMLAEIWINKKVKEDGGVIWEFDK